MELISASFDDAGLADTMRRISVTRSALLSPEEALRFLFMQDAYLYSQQSVQSIRYGQGQHSKHRHTGYHTFFINRLTPGQRVLDIGCGLGALAFDMAKKGGVWVVGIELEADKIVQATQRYSHERVEFRVGDVLRVLQPESFDVVVLSNVLEHLPNRADFLNQVAQKTQSKRFLIRVPLFERDWRVPLKKEVGSEWRLDTTHHTEYTQESFAEEMEVSGLCIAHQEIRWGEIWAEVVVKP